jgi:hypothetical protein
MTFLPRLVGATLAAASLFGLAGCLNATIEHRRGRILHLTCKNTKLQRCLDAAENACAPRRYAVLRAFDQREYRARFLGQPAVEYRDSEAYVVCGHEHAWGPLLEDVHADPLGDYEPEESAPPPANEPPADAPASP